MIGTNKMQFDKLWCFEISYFMLGGGGGSGKCDNSPRAPKT